MIVRCGRWREREKRCVTERKEEGWGDHCAASTGLCYDRDELAPNAPDAPESRSFLVSLAVDASKLGDLELSPLLHAVCITLRKLRPSLRDPPIGGCKGGGQGAQRASNVHLTPASRASAGELTG